MSVFAKLFGGQPVQQQQQPQQPQQPQSQQQQHVQANNQVPNNTNTPVQQPSPENPNPESPNSEFKDLWSTPTQQQPNGPNFQLDPAKLSERLQQTDFTKSVSRENAAKIMAGGEEGLNAMMDVLNTFGRDVFAKAATFSSNMAESSYQHATTAASRSIPDLVTQQLTQNELFNANPKLRDPALQPMVQAIQSQIRAKHPNATPTEVNGMVNKYFNDHVAKAFAPDQQQSTQKSANTSDDFSSFL